MGRAYPAIWSGNGGWIPNGHRTGAMTPTGMACHWLKSGGRGRIPLAAIRMAMGWAMAPSG
jgi:hypothetical protein